jgi:hypothetical protein
MQLFVGVFVLAAAALALAAAGDDNNNNNNNDDDDGGGGSSSTCATALDCSLNGDCIDSECVCDAPWAGSAQCDVLQFASAPKDGGYHNSTEASWGGNVVFADGKYHMFVAQFANSCPLDYWGSASTIVRAEAAEPLGPFIFQETVVPAFSHNPTIR